MSSLARWCFRHRVLVLAFWLVALVVIAGAAGAAKTAYSERFSLPHTQSTEAGNILTKDFPKQSGDNDQIVFEANHGTVTSPGVRGRVEPMLAKVASLPHVANVVSPYGPAGQGQISKSGTIAFAQVNFDQTVQDLPISAVKKVMSVAEGARSPGVQVQLNGQAIENAQPEKSSGNSTGLGVVFAIIVLGIVFGALFAAVIPIVTALIAIGIGYSITGLMSHVIAIASFVPILGLLLGLGVGVDYALFIITRHRKALRAGRSVEESAVLALNTSGRAVFFAGITVCIALLGQFTLGINFLYGLAIASTVTVALTVLAAMTLMPALLGIMGMRVLSRRERRQLREHGPISEEATKGFWWRWSRMIANRRTPMALGAFLLMVVIALPLFSIRLGLSDAGSDPPGTTTRAAYYMLARGFGPGFNGPFQLVATVNGRDDVAAFQRVVQATAKAPGVVAVTPPRVSPSGTAAVALLYPSTSPQARATTDLLKTLRHSVIPRAQSGSDIHVLVGGTTAGQQDFATVLSSKMWLFITVIVVLAFILLMAVFRSLLIPLIASVMNLLSIGAALGIMVAVFSWGWGSGIIGFGRTGPIEVFVPVIMISVLFGLSMDYEVFLVSRMHEEWIKTRDNEEAVTTGQTETGRVITAAALIMILVFLSFLLGGELIIDQFGVGLAGAIIVDAFIVRTVLVPALMHVNGRANWWLPAWLDRIVPHLHVDVPDPLEPIREPELV